MLAPGPKIRRCSPSKTPGSTPTGWKGPARPNPASVTSAPPPPPEPPKLPLKFFGYGTVPYGSARRAFFTDGEEVHVVAEGELLLNRFRILKVGNASLEFEEVSSGRRGTAILEEQGAPSSQ